MIDPVEWTRMAVARLRERFGDRLLYVGLQGSRRRGEATDKSDIDLVAILNRVNLDDLKQYRRIVAGLPEGEKTCGFVAGREELRNWPKHEIFQFKMDTDDYFGQLDPLLPEYGRDDIVASAQIGAANLYHALVHGFLFTPEQEWPGYAEALYKSSYFVLQAVHYLRTGQYPRSKAALLEQLEGREKEILAAGMDFARELAERDMEYLYSRLLEWCSGLVETLG